MLSSSYTATILLILVSLFLSISAIAACSVQNPIEHGTSMQMPVNIAPPTVSNAQPTWPASPFFFNFIGFTVRRAMLYQFFIMPSLILSFHSYCSIGPDYGSVSFLKIAGASPRQRFSEKGTSRFGVDSFSGL